MAVAGFFLIEGLSQFSGSGGAKKMLIIGGVLFQITESLCFISASALTYHSLRWRYILFTLGTVLFCFSIAVMTLAQKTALQSGEAQAQANDEQRAHIRNQIASLQQVIDSYRLNAENQSKSIYKDSRAMGQDSINRATELEERKFQLGEELFRLNTDRKQTSSDFFKRLEEVTGLPAKSTEFYFLVLRSLLLEMSGIILMSFGANLRAYNKLVESAGAKAVLQTNKSMLKQALTREDKDLSESDSDAPAVESGVKQPITKPVNRLATETASKEPAKEAMPPSTPDASPQSKPVIPAAAVKPSPKPPVNNRETQKDDDEKVPYWEAPALKQADSTNSSSTSLNYLATMVMDLYEQKLLRELNPAAIKESLHRYCSQNITHDTAGTLSTLINKRLDDTC
jgi:hypothetical protein